MAVALAANSITPVANAAYCFSQPCEAYVETLEVGILMNIKSFSWVRSSETLDSDSHFCDTNWLLAG